jgi:glycosyltransferase involved in cell wall biosynthesis
VKQQKALALTIVIPVYNEEIHLKRCLDSIAAQTMLPYQVIVADNNSTDNSVAVAQAYPFVRVVHERDQGIVHARNAGFNAVTSDIIGRIDADSILPSGWVRYIEKFYANPKNATTALTGGGYFYNVRLPKFNGWLQGQLAFRTNRLIMGHYILWGSNMAMPRAMWQAVQPSTCTRQDIHEDMDLAIHVVKAGYTVTYREHLHVGVKLKRIWEDRWEQRKHLARWPKTLKIHGFKLWWLGSAGNIFLAIIGEPYIFISEGLARLLGRAQLKR